MRKGLPTVVGAIAAAIIPSAVFLAPLAFRIAEPDGPFAWSRFGGIAFLAVLIAGAHVAFLGVPSFLLLQWKNAVTWWTPIALGFLLGCLPLAILSWPHSDSGSSASHWQDGRMVATVIDGVPTKDGWIEYAQGIAAMGGYGALGGVAFWLVWRVMRSKKSLELTREG